MDQQIKIALVGKKKAGRTFIAVYLEDNYRFKKWGLVDGVDRLYRMLYDYRHYERIHWEKQRDVYDYFYAQDPEVWVKFLDRRLVKTDRNVVIDDVRYISEVKYLQALGFKIIRVTAPDNVRQPRIAKQLGKAKAGTTVLHEYFNVDKTESYVVDYSIHNVNKDDTRATVDFILKNLTEG